MTAAAALINGLQGERDRWTEQSKEFRAQIGRSVTSTVSVSEFFFHLTVQVNVFLLKGKDKIGDEIYVVNSSFLTNNL